MKSSYQKTVEQMMQAADIKVGPDLDIEIKNENFYKRALAEGSLGLGESYIDGWWESKYLDQLVFKLLKANFDKLKTWNLIFHFAKAKLFNYQTKSRSSEVAYKHYDLGNELYKKMLDPTMSYTCGYWKNAKNLQEAQIAKLDLICRKIGLKPGMRVLDIGCGWGNFMKYASEKYGVKVVGVSLSKKQIELGQELCKGLPVEFQLKDYRDIEGKFDRIVSIEMIEAVGYKNFRSFFKVANEHLEEGGLFLLQTIAGNESVTAGEPWLDKYIFPNGMLPSQKQLSESMEGLFILEDLENFGTDYDKTLMAWFENFNSNWPEIKKNYDERFYRMWKYYLLQCAGIFRARKAQLWQFVLSKNGVPGGYVSIR